MIPLASSKLPLQHCRGEVGRCRPRQRIGYVHAGRPAQRREHRRGAHRGDRDRVQVGRARQGGAPRIAPRYGHEVRWLKVLWGCRVSERRPMQSFNETGGREVRLRPGRHRARGRTSCRSRSTASPRRRRWARGDVQFIGRDAGHETKNAGGKPVDFVIVAIK